jgi:hypothetical protein
MAANVRPTLWGLNKSKAQRVGNRNLYQNFAECASQPAPRDVGSKLTDIVRITIEFNS